MTPIVKLLQEAVARHRNGDFAAAETMYRQILSRQPDHPDALNLVGVIALQTGRPAQAVEPIQKAIRKDRNRADFHNNLGEAHRGVRNYAAAIAAYREALRLSPAFPQAFNNLGIALLKTGQLAEAAAACRRALELAPDFAEASLNLGTVFQEQGDFASAKDCYQRAATQMPTLAEAHNNLGILLRDEGAVDAAIAHYQKALAVQPNYPDACCNLGNVYQAKGDYLQAARWYEQALALQPDNADACNNLAQLNRQQGRIDDARRFYDHCVRIDPGNALWRLRARTVCPDIFPSSAAIEAYREQLMQTIETAAERPLDFDRRHLAISGAEPPYNTVYHGRDELPMRQAYGRLFHDRCELPDLPRRTGKPKVGFVVTERHEGIFARLLLGLVERLRSEAFDVVILCTAAGRDELKSRLRRSDVQFLVLPRRFDRLINDVLATKFDLLYQWEVDTDSTNYFMPHFRLAPVQVTSWGVQMTTGIPRMDYYISSRRIEPENAAEHYTEKLILLDTILSYQSRITPPAPVKSRSDFGLRDDQHLYCCIQQLGKFHPDYDAVIADILRRDPQGVLVTADWKGPEVSKQLRDRFRAAIPDVADRIVFLPRLAGSDYYDVLQLCDVMLDPIYYGGVTTAFDGLSLNQPIITWPWKYQRGRFTHGCYQTIGFHDCVAESHSDYVDQAVRLGTDADYRQFIREKLKEATPALFEDAKIPEELEQCFLVLIERSRSK